MFDDRLESIDCELRHLSFYEQLGADQPVYDPLRKHPAAKSGAVGSQGPVELAAPEKHPAVAVAERCRMKADFFGRDAGHEDRASHRFLSRQSTQSRPGTFPEPKKSSDSTSKAPACGM